MAVVKGRVQAEQRQQDKGARQIAKDALFAQRVADELAMEDLLAKGPLPITGGPAFALALTEFPTLRRGHWCR